MKPHHHLATALALTVTPMLTAADDAVEHDPHNDTTVAALVATVQPTQGSTTHGTVTFRETEDGVAVHGTIRNLTPNQAHGFHIHEFGDISDPEGQSAGGHFNPDGHKHGLPDDSERHAGDLGNLHANEHGVAVYDATIKGITLTSGAHAILGRALMIHAKPDDGGQPTGNAGARIALGVIGFKHGHPIPVSTAAKWKHEAEHQTESLTEKAKQTTESLTEKAKRALRKTGDALKTGAEKLDEKIEDATDGR